MSHNAAEPQAVSGQRSAKSTRGRECQGDLKLSGAPFSGTVQFIGRPIANRPQDAILPYIAGLEPQRAGCVKIVAARKEYEG